MRRHHSPALAIADGFAMELELPFENRLTDLKLGLQGIVGLLSGGCGIHGVRYLGLWNREHRRWESSLRHVIGYRLGARVSTLSMVGIGDVSAAGATERARLLNHTSF